MKNVIVAASLALLTATASQAQSYVVEPTNKDMLHLANRIPESARREFVLPAKIGGYLPLKTDLHMHTYFSDGHVSPATRVREAWLDGLDAIAITEHIEYHPVDDDMREYLRIPTAASVAKGAKAKKTAKKESRRSHDQDHNVSMKLAQTVGPTFDILVIPGTEITREPREIGHYNALFTVDNNTIYDDDPLQAIRNAKDQGALVMHNHPGWRRNSIDHPEFEKKAYAEGLIDGVEVINGHAFCPGLIDRAREKNLFPASTTDIHLTSAEKYAACGLNRDMTIVLANERSLKGLREGLEQRRTIALGPEAQSAPNPNCSDSSSTHQSKCHAQLKVQCASPTRPRCNSTSRKGENPILLPPFSSLILNPDESGKLTVAVLNMWSGASTHPTFTL